MNLKWATTTTKNGQREQRRVVATMSKREYFRILEKKGKKTALKETIRK